MRKPGAVAPAAVRLTVQVAAPSGKIVAGAQLIESSVGSCGAAGLTVKVARGENADRTLTHDAVTRRLSQAGRADKSGAFRQFVPIKLAGTWHANATHVTVFAQETGGPIVALATIKMR